MHAQKGLAGGLPMHASEANSNHAQFSEQGRGGNFAQPVHLLGTVDLLQFIHFEFFDSFTINSLSCKSELLQPRHSV